MPATATVTLGKATLIRESGLTADEAKKRLTDYGPNALPEPAVPGIFSIFFSQFLSPLIYILLAAAALLLFTGEIPDALIICTVLTFNAIVGTIQEGRSQRTLRALRQFVATSASVLRDGKIIVVPDTEVVPGDLIVLQEGDKIPADAKLLVAHGLKVNEASLTGESVPAPKSESAIGKAAMVFKGTNVVSGNGQALVTMTGTNTLIGKISEEIATIDTEMPLKKNIRALSKIIIIVTFIIAGAIILAGTAAGRPLAEMFAIAVAMMVSVIPEGLPIVITLILATGVWRMAKRSVLVKKLQAVEALGQSKIIAVDKTGTLTRNEMVLGKLYMNGSTFEIGGVGYEPTGEVMLNGKVVEPLNHPELILAGRVAGMTADAHAMYFEETKTWKVSGDPTEAALEVFARKVGFKEVMAEEKRIFELPFDYQMKYHVAINRVDGKNFLAAVGAPERILALSDRVWREKRSEKLGDEERAAIDKVFADLSRQGLRILAFGINNDSASSVTTTTMPPLTFCGFFAMKDPLRAEAIEAIREAHEAGIRVIMMTGDHKITAHAIATEAGLTGKKDGVVTGDELEKLSDKELMQKFGDCNVFARVTPDHKLRIVELFRKRGEVVAMTGDGVNDAPSLAAADLGVAMGKVGTEVAKEAADLVLLDDNFGSIIAAVEEGRSIYKTIKKVLTYLFSSSIGEVIVIAFAIFMGLPLPILPVQIIWLNFITDGFLVAALSMEPKENNLLMTSFKRPSKYILDSFGAGRTTFMGIIFAIGTLMVFMAYLSNGVAGIEKALTMSLTTLAVFQWCNAWNCKDENKSIFAINPLRNPFLVAATMIIIALQSLAIYHPFLQQYLHTVPLNTQDWFTVVVVAGTIVLLEEGRKALTSAIGRRAAL